LQLTRLRDLAQPVLRVAGEARLRGRGASIILAGPIFKGLAIALMAGEIASLLISRMAVPVLDFTANKHAKSAATPAS
jgi:hypothetical protein